MENFLEFARQPGGIDAAIYRNDAQTLRNILHSNKLLDLSVYHPWDVKKIESCAIFGQSEILRVLLEFGSKVPFDEGTGTGSPLRFACCCYDHYEYGDFPGVVRLLIAHGANIHERNKLGRTLLHYVAMASTSSSVEVASILIQNGLNVNVLSCLNETPLFTATEKRDIPDEQKQPQIFENQTNLVKFLLLEGVNPDTECRGVTPLRNAIDIAENMEMIDLLENVANLRERRDAVIEAFANHHLLGQVEDEFIDGIIQHNRKHDNSRIVEKWVRSRKR